MEVLKPIVDLPLEEIIDGKTPDLSANKVNVVLSENVQFIPDDQFGSCLLLAEKGTQLTFDLPNVSSNSFSLSFWHKGSPINQVLTSFEDASGKKLFQIITNEKGLAGIEATEEKSVSDINVSDKQWRFLAVVAKGEDLSLYVDSVLSGTLKVSGAATIKKLQLNGGCSLARSKVFDVALSQTAILNEQKTGQTAGHIFRTIHPLDFEFIDDEVKNVFYIVNLNQDIQQNPKLSIINTSSKNLVFKPLKEVSKESFHVEIRFRPQTFKDHNIDVVQSPVDWKAKGSTVNENGTLSFFLSYNGSHDLILPPEHALEFELNYRSAFGQLGGRGSQTLMVYQNIYYPDHQTPFSGRRTKLTEIVNQRGKRNIPMHIGFIGSNSILNDGKTENELHFRLVNTMKSNPLRLNSINNTTLAQKRSELTIHFEQIDGRRLISKSQESKISLSTGTPWASVPKNTQGNAPIFKIYDLTVDELPPNMALDFSLSKLTSNENSGFSSIIISYKNFPGYWDGEIVLEVEKSPIVHRNFSGERNAGIGVPPDENYKLKVGGGIHIEPSVNKPQFVIQDSFKIDADGNVGIGTVNPQHKLEVRGTSLISGDTEIQGKATFKDQISPSAGNGTNNGIIFPADPGGGYGDIASIKYYAQSGEATVLEILNANDSNDHIALTPSGNVGIGTTDPKEKLDIRGNLNVSERISVQGEPPIKLEVFKIALERELEKKEDGWVEMAFDTGYPCSEWNCVITGRILSKYINRVKVLNLNASTNWTINTIMQFFGRKDEIAMQVSVLFISNYISKTVSGYEKSIQKGHDYRGRPRYLWNDGQEDWIGDEIWKYYKR